MGAQVCPGGRGGHGQQDQGSAHPELPKPRDKAPPVGVVDTDGIVQKSHSEFIGVGVPGEGPDSAAGPGGGTGQGETPQHLLGWQRPFSESPEK